MDTIPRVPLKPTTIRVAPDALALIQHASETLGLSTAQFIREAAIMRAFITLREERAAGVLEEIRKLGFDAEVRRLARRDDPGTQKAPGAETPGA